MGRERPPLVWGHRMLLLGGLDARCLVLVSFARCYRVGKQLAPAWNALVARELLAAPGWLWQSHL
jgi:hypothetical protein